MLVALSTLYWPTAQAAGQLMVAPTRIVFEGRHRSAHVNLVNTGDELTTYRIALVRRRMTETGEFVDVETPQAGEQFADQMVRYSPRVVELPPGASQTIRLLLRKPANLSVGEYRSHLLFKALPPAADQSIEALAQERQGLTIQLTPIIGITIPVIVRHGSTEATVTLSDLQVTPGGANGPQVLSMTMNRAGNRSVYGDITVFFTVAGAKEQVVAQAKGVAVYTPNPLRRVKLTLQPPPNVQLTGGRLRVAYREQQADGGQPIAEATLDMP